MTICPKCDHSFNEFNEEDYAINRTINGYDLINTCSACPEQYDVFKDGKQVGYLRLRHGGFRADYPDCGGETIYHASPNGDGMFDAEERMKYLTEAINAIDKHIEREAA